MCVCMHAHAWVWVCDHRLGEYAQALISLLSFAKSNHLSIILGIEIEELKPTSTAPGCVFTKGTNNLVYKNTQNYPLETTL